MNLRRVIPVCEILMQWDLIPGFEIHEGLELRIKKVYVFLFILNNDKSFDFCFFFLNFMTYVFGYMYKS